MENPCVKECWQRVKSASEEGNKRIKAGCARCCETDLDPVVGEHLRGDAGVVDEHLHDLVDPLRDCVQQGVTCAHTRQLCVTLYSEQEVRLLIDRQQHFSIPSSETCGVGVIL